MECYELVGRSIELSLILRREVNKHPLISKYFRIATNAQMVPEEYRESGFEDFHADGVNWKTIYDAWSTDEFVLDPTRITLLCGSAGFDGTSFKGLLASKFDIQLNKTSRNSVLLQTNINNTRSDIAYLIKVLADMARELDRKLSSDPDEKAAFDARVKSLVTDVPDLPNFSRFHDTFREHPRGKTNEGDMRTPFFLAYDEEENCTYVKLHGKEIDDLVKSGQAVSAKFVIPYPPGFPIMVPGQVITQGHHRVHAQAGCERNPRLPGRLRPAVNQAGQARRKTEETQHKRKEERSTSTSDYRAQESLTSSRKLNHTYD